jgi:hypothetical protein
MLNMEVAPAMVFSTFKVVKCIALFNLIELTLRVHMALTLYLYES